MIPRPADDMTVCYLVSRKAGLVHPGFFIFEEAAVFRSFYRPPYCRNVVFQVFCPQDEQQKIKRICFFLAETLKKTLHVTG